MATPTAPTTDSPVRNSRAAETFLKELPAADHPYMVEHINYHIDTGVLGEGDFEFGLDLLLDSLERLRNSHSDIDPTAWTWGQDDPEET